VSVLEHAFADGAGDGFGEKIPSYGVFVSISGFGWRWYTLQVSVTRVFATLGLTCFPMFLPVGGESAGICYHFRLLGLRIWEI
jgi:hypothetical protein